MPSLGEKSKVLIIGATGYLGKFMVAASAKAGHSTFALIRESTASDPEKVKTIEDFKNAGVTLVYVSKPQLECLWASLSTLY